MQSKTNSVIYLAIFLFFNVTNCSAQKELMNHRKSETNVLIKEIEQLKESNQNLQNQINTSLSISQSSNSCIANKLDSMNLIISVFALFLTLIVFMLGVYINRKEKAINKILIDGKANLATQIEIQDDINNNISDIFSKVKREEFNEIIQSIESDPQEIHNYYFNLLSLKLVPLDYDILSNKIRIWHENKIDNENVIALLNVLFLKFPAKIQLDNRIAKLIVQYWWSLVRRIPYNTVISNMNHFYEKFKSNKDPESKFDLKIILENVNQAFNGNIIAKEIFNNIAIEKNDRFNIYQLIKENNMFPLFTDLAILIKKEYENDESNNSLQSEIIDSITNNK